MAAPASVMPRRHVPLRTVANAAAIGALVFAWVFIVQGDFLYDARAYWSVDLDDPYGGSLVGRRATYLYSPAFAQLSWPLTLLPWTVFAALFCGLNLLALTWMVGPVLAALLLFIPWSPVTDEITTGNIHLLIAAAIVIGMRWPAAWAFPLLTKVTPGVGVLWFAAARRWRAALVATGVTAAIVATSILLSPAAWSDWITLLIQSSAVDVPTDIGVIPGPLLARTAAAAALVAVGGWRGWWWTLPVAAVLALPVTWSSGLSILVALVPLYRRSTHVRP